MRLRKTLIITALVVAFSPAIIHADSDTAATTPMRNIDKDAELASRFIISENGNALSNECDMNPDEYICSLYDFYYQKGESEAFMQRLAAYLMAEIDVMNVPHKSESAPDDAMPKRLRPFD